MDNVAFASRAALLRQTLWRQLDQAAYKRDTGLSPVNKGVVLVVVIASLLGIIGTEPSTESWWPELFDYSDIIFAWLFCFGYLLRLWVEGENPRFAGILGKFRYALTPTAIIDLVAFLPMLIAPGSNLFLLRVCRLLRITSLARLGRFSLAVDHLSYAVRERRGELLLSLHVSYTNSCILVNNYVPSRRREQSGRVWKHTPSTMVERLHANHCWLWRYLPAYGSWQNMQWHYCNSRHWADCHANRNPGRGF